MKIEKIHLDNIERCYCASHIKIDGKEFALLASEAPNTICNAYTGENFSNKENVWKDRTGCMSIVQIPNKENEFLAINNFSLNDQPSTAKLIWGKRINGEWLIKDLFSLPFLHRFDVFAVNDKNYLVCATIAKDKHGKNDWSEPGQIFVGLLPDDINEEIKLQLLVGGYFRNHGYSRAVYNGNEVGYFSSDQGVIRITPPYDGKWRVEKVLDGNISEIAFNDLDNDGIDEMITIEPFHGDVIKIYKYINGKYLEVYKYDKKIEFAHALVADNILGVKSFVCGVRRMNAELFIIQHINGEYKTIEVDKNVGPANLSVIHNPEADYIVAANHTISEAALYKITKE